MSIVSRWEFFVRAIEAGAGNSGSFKERGNCNGPGSTKNF